jgi:hypothetical protein
MPRPRLPIAGLGIVGVGLLWCGLTWAQRAPLLQHADGPAQIRDVGGQATHAQLVLVLYGAGDRPGPSRRRPTGDRPLTLRAPRRAALRVEHTAADPPGQLGRNSAPRNAPMAVKASASASVGRIRVRIRTADGAAATSGSPIRRNLAVPAAMHHMLTATTDTKPRHTNTHYRAPSITPAHQQLHPRWIGPTTTVGIGRDEAVIRDQTTSTAARTGRASVKE